MTVSELVRLLSAFNPDTVIETRDSECGGSFAIDKVIVEPGPSDKFIVVIE